MIGAVATERRSLSHELFQQRLGAEWERYCEALNTIAALHAKWGAPQLGWRVTLGKAHPGKHIDIIVKELS